MPSLRPISLRLRRKRTAPTVESLTELLGLLNRERENLRAANASAIELERNRVAICRAQWDLSHALIARHLPKPAAAQDAA
jgi:hypothetical protein